MVVHLSGTREERADYHLETDPGPIAAGTTTQPTGIKCTIIDEYNLINQLLMEVMVPASQKRGRPDEMV